MVTIDKARRSAGGAGYQANSGFAELFYAASPVPTYEGDNTLMMLQSARFVFKLLKKAKKGQVLPYPFEYISKAKELLDIKGKGTSLEDMTNIQTLDQALAVRALIQIINTSKAIEESKEPAKVNDNELFSRMKLEMIKAHIEYLSFYLFLDKVKKTELKDDRIKPILMDLYKIAALNSLREDSGSVFESEYFAPTANKNMKLALDALISKVRP